MKKIFTTIILSTFFLSSVYSQDTFSIVAVDPATGEVGSAGASCIGAPTIPQGAKIISDMHPGVGVIHTQAYYYSGNQAYGKELMNQGYSPQQIIDSLVANDVLEDPTLRQYGVVDFTGAAGYSGINCDDYKNHVTGPTYAIQGNILLGQPILDSMEARFLNTPGNLACKLMAALQGAKVPGADTRCLTKGISSLSAFIRVAKPIDTTGILYLDLNVPGVPIASPGNYIDPIDSLQTLFDAWGGCIVSGANEFTLAKSNLKVYPNPARGYLIIASELPIITIFLHDDLAIEVWRSKTQGGEKNIRLPLSGHRIGYLIFEAEFKNGSKEVFSIVTQ